MEENNKQLLIKDICARLPYGVYVKFKQYNEPLCLSVKDALAICNGGEIINDLQYLYLRPMSSMTEEERRDYDKLIAKCTYDPDAYFFDNYDRLYDYLNTHYFDFRGLIPMGFALEAPKNMY